MPSSETEPGIPFKWSEDDKTLIQMDWQSVKPDDARTFEIMTAYNYVVTLERVQRITTYRRLPK